MGLSREPKNGDFYVRDKHGLTKNEKSLSLLSSSGKINGKKEAQVNPPQREERNILFN